MKLEIKRIIVFAAEMAPMMSFYENVLGLSRIETPSSSQDFVTLDAGACQLCLHAVPRRWREGVEIADPREPRVSAAAKPAFYSKDVSSLREELIERGARMGEVHSANGLDLCDGTDPEGNIFQISNR